MNMNRTIKNDLLPKLQARYARRSRDGKTRMLDELCEDYGYERKYAIKLLCGTVPPSCGRVHPGPEPRYSLIEPIVRMIWLAAEQPCGKRLAPALSLWLPHTTSATTARSVRASVKLSVRSVPPPSTGCWLQPAPNIPCAAAAAPSPAACSRRRFPFAPALGT